MSGLDRVSKGALLIFGLLSPLSVMGLFHGAPLVLMLASGFAGGFWCIGQGLKWVFSPR